MHSGPPPAALAARKTQLSFQVGLEPQATQHTPFPSWRRDQDQLSRVLSRPRSLADRLEHGCAAAGDVHERQRRREDRLARVLGGPRSVADRMGHGHAAVGEIHGQQRRREDRLARALGGPGSFADRMGHGYIKISIVCGPNGAWIY